MKSSIYSGVVFHKRHGDVPHLLKYKIFYLLLDLDEVESLGKRIPFFSTKGFNLVKLDTRLHGAEDVKALKDKISDLAMSRFQLPDITKIKLLTIPKIAGYAFNPLSVFFCYDGQDVLKAIVYEVRNTFGEKHLYPIEVSVDKNGKIEPHQAAKQFFVSPFQPLEGFYEFEIDQPTDMARILIDYKKGEQLLLSAGFSGSRQALTAASLAGTLARLPFTAIKVMAGIHWEALKLWIKGAEFYSPSKRHLHPNHKAEQNG